MHSVWLKNHRDRTERKKEIQSYRNAFDALREVLESEYKKKDSIRDYGPGWAEKQIAVNEYNAALTDILTLINIDKETK